MMKYTINQHGVIKVDGTVIPMEEKSSLYKEYVQFLEQGGSVEDEAESSLELAKQSFETKTIKERLVSSSTGLQVHDQAIENILAHLQVLQNQVDALQNEKSVIRGISGYFKSLDGKTITIKNGIIKSITVKNK